ncbi:DUF559 domain-containing protein [Vulcaniibacterium gelatinicum]|uniref:DUF559 domain-containing protein n=1 Tax=Vulcaniibacterium gelatinicum TaxID=2598725 RepID=UPI0011CC9EA8|nr:endonuclease domain-containing protein [Vulcaniibacterium gelatinicum]
MRRGRKRDVARGLRRAMTDAERSLWRHLRQRQVLGHKFRRQHPIGPCIADFVCLEATLVVEVDGGQHMGSDGDRRRDAHLRKRGFRVLRFWNDEVLGNADGVWWAIAVALSGHENFHISC